MNVLGTASLVSSDTASSTGTGSSRASGGSDGGKPSRFDALLQDKPAPAQASNSGVAAEDGNTSTAPAKGNDDTATEAESPAAEASRATDTPATPDKEAPVEDAPWPPLGLTALLAAPLEPAPVPAPVQPPAPAPANAAPTATLPVTAASIAATPAAESAELTATQEQVEQTLIGDKTGGDKGIDVDINVDPKSTAFNQLLQLQNGPDLRTSAVRLEAPTPTPDLQGDDFDDAIGARVSWLAEQKIGHAQIRITPHDLGQVDVKLQLDGDRVHASFTSAHSEVRQALENSLPRLREMLGEQGLQLAHADVGQQSPQQEGQHGSGDDLGHAQDSTDLPAARPQTLRLRGLLDAYA
ncbi:flagellar hook-length control protein FliK [Stenotrophomonas sp. MH1]|uniref:Flagellar hook-length control protein FliK n=1 Tax=Stenotrophomonas capsici TaxID=3110230 RepID=A0ABU5V4V6_9GAMM|nr:flagellar hook-length control protein FliK [Stenotrophomonas sp. MH1]MEA5668388.1 flagellar hook-length control protein FliK [Stenotrophomonas sp. MH1]